MNKRNLLIFLAVVLLGSLVFGRLLNVERVSKEQRNESTVKSTSVERKTVNAEITVDTGVKISTFSATVPVGGSVLDALKEVGNKNNFSVSGKEYPPYGEMVVEIDGVNNGKDNKFWGYYVNGEYAKEGASVKKLEEGNKILWKFESSKW